MSTKAPSPGLEAFERAIEICGGQSALARGLTERTGEQIDQGHIWSWLHRSRRVPSEMAPHIEHLCAERGKRITREELCPEFPWHLPRAKPARRTRV